jgi:signal transduction histidine kinase
MNHLLSLLIMSIILFQAIFIFLQYIVFKRQEYLYYILYIITIGFFLYFQQEARFGLSNITTNSKGLKNILGAPLILFSFFAYLHFGQKFLDITKERKVYPVLFFLKSFILVEALLFIILTPFNIPQAVLDFIFDTSAVLLVIQAVWVVVLLLKEKNTLNNFIIAGGLIIAVGGGLNSIINLFQNIEGAKTQPITLPLEIAVFVELILLNTGLFYKTKLIETTNTQTQLQIIEEYKINAALQTKLNLIRSDISKDLHDEVGGTLSSMHMFADMASSIQHKQPEESKKMMDKIAEISKSLMVKMNDIIWSLQPVEEEKNALENRLYNYAHELLSPKNISCGFNIDETLSQKITNPDHRKTILLIAKEAINNIAKYSNATDCEIAFTTNKTNIELLIMDNGIGFNKDLIKKGNGLTNIEARCQKIGGTCTITGVPGRGTKILCTFPIAIFSYMA